MLTSFYEGARTASANVHALPFSLVEHHLFLDVGFPLSIGGLFGVTHTVTELRPLSTDLTFRHRSTSLSRLMITTGAMIPQTGHSRNRGARHSAALI
jgi:hypothetical protein